jgi:hypothetical protein
MPSPAWRMPFSGLPEPGIGVPIAAELFGPSSRPVRGSLALSALPEQIVAPLQPGT